MRRSFLGQTCSSHGWIRLKQGWVYVRGATTTEVKAKDHFLRINMKTGPIFDLEVGKQATGAQPSSRQKLQQMKKKFHFQKGKGKGVVIPASPEVVLKEPREKSKAMLGYKTICKSPAPLLSDASKKRKLDLQTITELKKGECLSLLIFKLGTFLFF